MDFALAIDHVQVAMPVGGEERARAFFGALLGLTELPKPADMAVRGGCWFALGDRQLHLGAETDFRPAKKAHVALALEGLDALRARIEAAGHATHEIGRAHVSTPVTNAHLVCRLLLEKKKSAHLQPHKRYTN